MTAEDNPSGPSALGLRTAAFRRSAAQVRDGLRDLVRHLSTKARIALGLGMLAAVLLGISAYVSLPSATLKLVCRHDFRSAELTVSVDGEEVERDTVTGTVRKLFGVIERTEGTYTRTLPVSSGKHVVQVRVRGTGYDRTRSIPGEFPRGREATLAIDAGRDLILAWRNTASVPEATAGSGSWFRSAASILMTILGSVISASIGVLVQDFLRSRKIGLPTPSPVEPPPSRNAP